MLDRRVNNTENSVRALMPTDCRWSFYWGAPGTYPLYPEEVQAVAGAVPKRRREFSTGRRCAREALALSGVVRAAIPMSSDRAPVWPDGFCGSITHCDGFCAAVVARQVRVRSVGIDAELRRAVSLELADRILTRDDWAQRPVELANDPCDWATMVFAIKEASFKAYYPLGGRILNFDSAKLALEPDRRSCQVAIDDGHSLEVFQCRFAWDDDRVYAGAYSAAKPGDWAEGL